MTWRRWVIAIGVLALAIAATAAVTWLLAQDGEPSGPAAVDVQVGKADLEFLIPAGTGVRLDRGETVDLLPRTLDARVGQTIRIVNRDDRDYALGPFIVGAHETMTQRFTSPGTFEGVCAVHPSGQIRVTVRA